MFTRTPNYNATHDTRWILGEYERHGGDYVQWKHGAHLFANGARIVEKGSFEPPTDPYERAQLVVEFYDIKVSLFQERFNELHAACMDNAGNGFSEEDREKLLAISAQAEPFKEKLLEAKAELERVTPYHLTAAAAVERAKHAARRAEIEAAAKQAIEKITF